MRVSVVFRVDLRMRVLRLDLSHFPKFRIQQYNRQDTVQIVSRPCVICDDLSAAVELIVD